MNDGTKREGTPPKSGWRFSLRALLGVTVLGSSFMLVTFDSYFNGGYTPGRASIVRNREVNWREADDYFGNSDYFGAPFNNGEYFRSWKRMGTEEEVDRSYEERWQLSPWGIACNVVFWQIFAAGLWWCGKRAVRFWWMLP